MKRKPYHVGFSFPTLLSGNRRNRTGLQLLADD